MSKISLKMPFWPRMITDWQKKHELVHQAHLLVQVRLRQFEACISSGAVWDSLPITESKNTDSIEFEKLNEAVISNFIPNK